MANDRKKTWPAVDGVHTDPVPEQRASPPATGGVDGQHGDGKLVLLIQPESPDELVGQRGLTRIHLYR